MASSCVHGSLAFDTFHVHISFDLQKRTDKAYMISTCCNHQCCAALWVLKVGIRTTKQERLHVCFPRTFLHMQGVHTAISTKAGSSNLSCWLTVFCIFVVANYFFDTSRRVACIHQRSPAIVISCMNV